MKSYLFVTAILFISMSTEAQKTFIQTNIGKIAIHKTVRTSDKLPVILLHGVYFDHHLWDEQVKQINDRTVVTIDMPLHGESREITKPDWSLNDCADMLIEILNSLQISKVIAVGHSWGSMTLLRAASKHPERFEGIGVCNMPFEAASPKQKRMFKLQHTLLFFRKFYTKQSAKSLFGKASLKENPDLLRQLERPMNLLSIDDIKQIDNKVILEAEDATSLIQNLQVKAIALKGKQDYVSTPPKIETIIIEGGHISPLEEGLKVFDLIRTLIDIKAQ
jgi:pimeloyl-ACP methyl ester carboxylesterase